MVKMGPQFYECVVDLVESGWREGQASSRKYRR